MDRRAALVMWYTNRKTLEFKTPAQGMFRTISNGNVSSEKAVSDWLEGLVALIAYICCIFIEIQRIFGPNFSFVQLYIQEQGLFGSDHDELAF